MIAVLYSSYIEIQNNKWKTLIRVELATFFAPVAYVDHMKSPIRYIAPFAWAVEVSKFKDNENNFFLKIPIFLKILLLIRFVWFLRRWGFT